MNLLFASWKSMRVQKVLGIKALHHRDMSKRQILSHKMGRACSSQTANAGRDTVNEYTLSKLSNCRVSTSCMVLSNNSSLVQQVS